MVRSAGIEAGFSEVLHSGYDAAGFMLDSPPEGKADSAAYDAVIDVFIEAARGAPTRAALIASLPETMSPRIRQRCLDGGVVPLQGQREALEAISLSGSIGPAWKSNPSVQLHLPPSPVSAFSRVRRLANMRARPHWPNSACAFPREGSSRRMPLSRRRTRWGFPGGHQSLRRSFWSTRPRWAV